MEDSSINLQSNKMPFEIDPLNLNDDDNYEEMETIKPPAVFVSEIKMARQSSKLYENMKFNPR